MNREYIAPTLTRKTFTCPHCNSVSVYKKFDPFKAHIEFPTDMWGSELDQDERPIPLQKVLGFDAELTNQYYISICTNETCLGLIFWETHDIDYPIHAMEHEKEAIIKQVEFFRNQSFIEHRDFDMDIVYLEKMLWPQTLTGTEPNPDIPKNIARYYDESRLIFNLSPAGAGALLRKTTEEILKERWNYIENDIGEEAEKENLTIGKRVKFLKKHRYFHKHIIDAIENCILTGNDIMHEDYIDFQENKEILKTLFHCINLIAHKLYTEPKDLAKLANIRNKPR